MPGSWRDSEVSQWKHKPAFNFNICLHNRLKMRLRKMNQNDSSAIITQVITVHHVLMGITQSCTRWLALRCLPGPFASCVDNSSCVCRPCAGYPTGGWGVLLGLPGPTRQHQLPSVWHLFTKCRPRTEPKRIKGARGCSCFFIQSLLPVAGERKYKTSKHTRSPRSQNRGEGESADGHERGGRRGA